MVGFLKFVERAKIDREVIKITKRTLICAHSLKIGIRKINFLPLIVGFYISQISDAMATSKAFAQISKKVTRVQSHLMQNYAAPIPRYRFGKHIASTFSDENGGMR